MTWVPPARAPWVEKLVAFGEGLGDDGRSVVSLDADDLTTAARAATGLDDVGDGWFRDPMERLCRALDDEAELHLPGRLRARGELQVILENRLRLVDLWKSEPAIDDEIVRSPIIVTGLGRSGTTLLHELLACDPANRPALLWELVHTVPGAAAAGPARKATNGPDWVAITHAEITMMDEMVPAFTSMHENGGHLPTECIFAFAHQFSSDMFTGIYNVPSYTIWKSGVDQTPAYDWHRRMLKTLQWASPTQHWVVKAPSHLSELPLVFATYPDARVVMTHRDPLRVVGSLADTIATLHWMHSNRVAHDTVVEFLCMGVELQMNGVTAERDAGTLPLDQITDVLYSELTADPLGTLERVYGSWGMELSGEARAAMSRYVEERHVQRSTGEHRYRFEDTGLDLVEHRALVADYQRRFGVPSEV
ncbi:MAG TPA: sulfotransferase [Acidimicrobiales bacterium]|nr:sulfotransferase [Acidimicrobiales bacterium]